MNSSNHRRLRHGDWSSSAVWNKISVIVVFSLLILQLLLLLLPGTASAPRKKSRIGGVRRGHVIDHQANGTNVSVSSCPGQKRHGNGHVTVRGRMISCLKKCRVDQDCIGGNRKCVCDGECGLSCVRPKQKCHDLPEMIDGWYEIDPPEGGFNSIVRYTCDPGFILIGHNERRCQGDKHWSGNAPICELEGRCGAPPVVEHATHSAPSKPLDDDDDWATADQMYRLGTVLVYNCTRGYYIDGYTKATCMGEGHWVGPTMRCLHDNQSKEEAVRLASYLNVEVVSKVQWQAYLRHHHRPARRCPHPGNVANAERLKAMEFHYPQVITYRCLEGYELQGHSQRKCLDTGQWSDHLPVCRQIKCQELGPIDHGHVDVSDMRYGAVARYQCKTGHRLEGPEYRTCQPDGTWSDYEPSCPAVDCGSIEPFYNGFKRDEVETTYGANVTLIRPSNTTMATVEPEVVTTCICVGCMGGSSFIDSESEIVLKCQADGTWNQPVPICWRECEKPQIENGYIVAADMEFNVHGMIKHGQEIHYECSAGYTNGTTEPKCDNGTWSVQPTCVPAPCPARPREVNNVRVRVYSMGHNDIAMYWCDPGFELVGPKFTRCLYGNWTEDAELPYCNRVLCNYTGLLDNGQVLLIGIGGKFIYRDYVKQVKHNDRIEYVCDRDYFRIGPSMATCIDGHWSPPKKPLCVQRKHPGTPLMYRGRRSVTDDVINLDQSVNRRRRRQQVPFPTNLSNSV